MNDPKWLEVAIAEIGVHETPGPQATQRIVDYHACTSLKATSDEVAWCASFTGWCLLQAGVRPTGSAAAKSYLNWGVAYPPTPGAICVIRKKVLGIDQATGSTSGYHVAFFISQTDTHVKLLGGNQGDSVKYSDFPLSKYSIEAMRWPLQSLPKAA